jgi:hypothetical protein
MKTFIFGLSLNGVHGLEYSVFNILIASVIFAVIVGYLGKNRKIGFINAFLFSFFCTPITGIILVFLSKKPIKCLHCDYENYENFEYCPECGKNAEGIVGEIERQNVKIQEELREAVENMKLVSQGKLTARPAEDLLNEL